MKNIINNVSNQDVFTGAFLKLFDEYKEFYDEEEFENIVEQVDLYSLSQVVTHRMEKIFAFTAKTDTEFVLQYQSKPLIESSACLIYTENDSASCSHMCQSYNTELWITEEFDFVLVKSFIVEYPSLEPEYVTTYRTIEKYNPELCDLPFSVEELIDELINFTGNVFEGNTPICEI